MTYLVDMVEDEEERKLPIGKSALIGVLATFVDLSITLPLAAVVMHFSQAEPNPYQGISYRSLVIGAVFVAPVMEEIVFRYAILGLLRKFFGTIIAIVGSALLFALAHTGFHHMLFVFPGGIILALVRVHTGRIWPSMISHCLFNSAIMLLIAFTRNLGH